MYSEEQIKEVYMNCANSMYVVFGNLPFKDVSFKVLDAEMIEGANHGELILIPKKPFMLLQLFYKDSLWATERFTVRLMPKPSVEIFVNDAKDPHQINTKVASVNKLSVKVIVDELFAKTVLHDANYNITAVEVSLARGKTLIGKIIRSENTEINLSEMSKLMQPDDKLIVEIKGIERTDFRGNTEEVNIGSKIFMIQIK